MNRYESVLAFVQADHGRLHGAWHSYGRGWVDGHSTAATWFVGFVDRTGEVIAVQTTPETGAVQVLGVIPSRNPREVDQLLVGWRDVAPPMLDWVRERLLLHQRHPEFYRQSPSAVAWVWSALFLDATVSNLEFGQLIENADAADLRASFERELTDWKDE